jgi:hypothetical protein
LYCPIASAAGINATVNDAEFSSQICFSDNIRCPGMLPNGGYESGRIENGCPFENFGENRDGSYCSNVSRREPRCTIVAMLALKKEIPAKKISYSSAPESVFCSSLFLFRSHPRHDKDKSLLC